jgi:hypothetical protein
LGEDKDIASKASKVTSNLFSLAENHELIEVMLVILFPLTVYPKYITALYSIPLLALAAGVRVPTLVAEKLYPFVGYKLRALVG